MYHTANAHVHTTLYKAILFSLKDILIHAPTWMDGDMWSEIIQSPKPQTLFDCICVKRPGLAKVTKTGLPMAKV